jgi:hypothetical protein
MKIKLLLILLFLANAIAAQDKMTSNNGIIVFEASVPFFEEVEAINKVVSCVFNPKNSTIYYVAYISQFQFERNLMEQHFNENYLESRKYPKATFKGVIEKFELRNITKTAKEYHIKGKIYIHGKSKNIRVLAKIKKTPKGIEILSNFTLNTDDFKIKIPSIVISKVSKNVNVETKFILQ